MTEKSKLEKVLSKNKVIEVLTDFEFYYQYPVSNFSGEWGNLDDITLEKKLEETITRIVHRESSYVIQDFCSKLKNRLENCEPDYYPCALCYDADNEPNV